MNACPASEHLLLMYVAHMKQKGLKHTTMQVYLAATRSLHIQQGYGNPLVNCLRLRRALKAVVNESSPAVQKLPITYDILTCVGKVCCGQRSRLPTMVC